MRAAVIAVALACGCGNAPPPTGKPAPAAPADAAADAPLAHDLARLAERGVNLFVEIADAFAAAGTDCATATARLGEIQRSYADVIEANARVLHEGRAKELKAALIKHEAALDAAAKAIVESPTMSTCSQDAAFTRAFDAVSAPP